MADIENEFSLEELIIQIKFWQTRVKFYAPQYLKGARFEAEYNEALNELNRWIVKLLENHFELYVGSLKLDPKGSQPWAEDTKAIIRIKQGVVSTQIPVRILRKYPELYMKVRNKMSTEFYVLQIFPKKKFTMLDKETNQLVTLPQGLKAGTKVLIELMPSIGEAKAERLLTKGGLIEGLDFKTAKNLHFKLGTHEAQYVQSVIQLSVSATEVLKAFNGPSVGESFCNNDWGNSFIENPFEVIRRVLEAPDEVKIQPYDIPHSYWEIRQGGETITLWRYKSGGESLEYELGFHHGMTHIKYDDELFFLFRKAAEEANKPFEEAELKKLAKRLSANFSDLV